MGTCLKSQHFDEYKFVKSEQSFKFISLDILWKTLIQTKIPRQSRNANYMQSYFFFSCYCKLLELTDPKPEYLLLYINLSLSANMC